jgi:hypothetical protein
VRVVKSKSKDWTATKPARDLEFSLVKHLEQLQRQHFIESLQESRCLLFHTSV